jgi:hypothetical protein
MITLEHAWNNLNQQLENKNYTFYCKNTKQILPSWYHVDLLKDNDQILIEEVPSGLIKKECFKHISKKKQLRTCITNRSFIITNKNSIPNAFFKQWEEGKMHKNTNNCQMIF